MVVYFADHLAHSIQIDAINRLIERNTRRTIIQEEGVPIEEVPPEVPGWAVPLLGRNSGYIQTVHPQLLLPLAVQHGVTIGLRHRVGQHSGRRNSPWLGMDSLAGRAAAERRVL
jgi:uncharacterized membrane protein